MLSDYFNITLDELVKNIDVQDVREKNLTDEKISSIFSDIERAKNICSKLIKYLSISGYFVLFFTIIVFVIVIIRTIL